MDMFLIADGKVGEGPEEAHVDVLIGDKDGAVGYGFAAAMANPSPGHVPLLAVLEPNLQTKPATLLVPKIAIKNLRQADLAFGPVQAAIARAVADSVEEGTVPKDKVEDVVMVCCFFVHPKAEDKEKIYAWNYEAMKLAIKRAFLKEPSIDTVLKQKDELSRPAFKT